MTHEQSGGVFICLSHPDSRLQLLVSPHIEAVSTWAILAGEVALTLVNNGTYVRSAYTVLVQNAPTMIALHLQSTYRRRAEGKT